MTDPITVGTIAALAFTKFLETGAGEAAKKLTPAVIEKIDALRKKIWAKLKGIPVAEELNTTAEKGGTITKQQIDQLTPLLETAMKEDNGFAQEIRQLAHEINQEINIGEILGKNIQNVYGGSSVQINDPNAPVFTGDFHNSPVNITINN